MEFTQIHSMKVSRIAIGTWAIGGWMWGGTEEKTAIQTLLKAFEKGINLVDTAPVYGFGVAEEIVGKALKQWGRKEIRVATKVGLNWDHNHTLYRDSSRKRIHKEVEDSLKRLQVDAIDLYQVHWPDVDTPFAETAATLKELLDQGKIRTIGVSNFSLEQMQEFQKSAPIHTAQPPFNLFERELENTVLAYCLKEQIETLGYGSLCRGLLSGKMKKDTPFKGDDIRKKDPKFQEPAFSQYLQCVDKLDRWSKQKYQRPVLALAVRWALDKGIHVALWGARKPEQLKDIDSVWGWKLTPQDLKEIDQIVTESIPHPIGPEFMAPPEHIHK